ncbi:MAG TPA: response regulator transcription factor, partial [Dehalococcoidia bacterium]
DLVRSALSYARIHGVPVLVLLQSPDGADDLLAPGGAGAADDFLLPPFRATELLLRCRQALDRRQDSPPGAGALRVGAVELDPGTYRVSVHGRLVSLTYREFELLRYLMERPGQYVTRDVLLDRVWGTDFQGSLRTVDVHIWRLRTKLGLDGESFIESLRGVGYRIRAAPA